jgi:hypothetical protein
MVLPELSKTLCIRSMGCDSMLICQYFKDQHNMRSAVIKVTVHLKKTELSLKLSSMLL